MKTSFKRDYAAPTFEVLIVELEQGIAGTSRTVSDGQPGLEDWTTGGSEEQNGEL